MLLYINHLSFHLGCIVCILFDRCDGEYTVTIYQPGFKPNRLEDDNMEEHLRYGLISSSNGDAISYAKQASESAVITLPSGARIHVTHIFARPPKGEDGISIALTKEASSSLIESDRKARTRIVFEAYVMFELKHSYFQRLHTAVHRLLPSIMAKIMPDKDNFRVGLSHMSIHNPHYDELQLDETGQLQALHSIISSNSNAPILIVGPFGTGKTRLLARAAYQILTQRSGGVKPQILVCAHHQASVDTFMEYFGQMKLDGKLRHSVNLTRIIPNGHYRSKTRNEYDDWYKTKDEIHHLNKEHIHLVVTTLSTAPKLYYKGGNGFFTHILMDEGAQTREPESVAPLCLANDNTKIVIAGDHYQVFTIYHHYMHWV